MKTRINFAIDEELASELKEAAWEQRKSTSKLISEIVAEYIKNREERDV